VHTDASGFVIDMVIYVGRTLNSFESKRLTRAHLKWPTHEREVFAVVSCLKAWQHGLS
jgi:hypothetical protein